MKIYTTIIIFILSVSFCFASNDNKLPDAATLNQQIFIENAGQWNSEIGFLAKSPGMAISISEKGLIYDFYQANKNSRKGHVVSMQFNNGEASYVIGGKELSPRYNYFIGNNPASWVKNARTYESLIMDDIYTGIGARLYFDGSSPRYDIIVSAGADPSQIGFDIEGAEEISVTAENEIRMATSVGDIFNGKVFAYQEIDGDKRQIECAFEINDGIVGFNIGDYDRSRPLIIDPLVYCTYYGGSDADRLTDVESRENSFYVCGTTRSTDINTTPGAYEEMYKDADDIIVAKFNIEGSVFNLDYATLMGGYAADIATAMDVDNNGNVYVTGYTESPQFPVYESFGQEYREQVESFVFELGPAGDELVYSGLIGGTKDDHAYDIHVDRDGAAYICGGTSSRDFRLEGSILQNTNKGLTDIFVAKISSSGRSVNFSTYIGGNSIDIAYGIDVDNAGVVYLTGETSSGDFPIEPFKVYGHNYVWHKPYDYTFNGGKDAFLIKLGGDGGSLVISTYFGGTNDDIGRQVAVDTDGTMFIIGESKEEQGVPEFPVSDNAYNTQNSGGWDCFFAKLDKIKESGTGYYKKKNQALIFSTFFGGRRHDYVSDIDFDKNYPAMLMVGSTTSDDFPTNNSNSRYMGKSDAYFLKFTLSGGSIDASGYIGGEGDDVGESITFDYRYDYFICGSTEGDLSTTENSFQPDFNGVSDGFITKNVKGAINMTAPSGGQSYCPDTKIEISWNTEELGTAMEFNIQLGRLSTGEWQNLEQSYTETSYLWTIPGDLEPADDYVFRITHPSGIKAMLQDPIKIMAPPVIIEFVAEPENLTVCQGENVRFSASAKGPDINYRWYFNGEIIEGESDSVLVIENIDPEEAGNYKLVVSNQCTPDAISDLVSVNVNLTTGITEDLADQTAMEGETVEFDIKAVGADLEYEWYKDGESLIGETNHYTIADVRESDEGLYKCMVSGKCGTAESYEAQLTVEPDVSVHPGGSSFGSDKIYIKISGGYENDIIKINLRSELASGCELYITDLSGRKVGTVFSGALSEGDNYFEYNTNSLNIGIYWIVARCGAHSAVHKFQVIR